MVKKYIKKAAKKDKQGSPAGVVLNVPVAEAPAMAKRISMLRRKNDRLKKVIDLLLDEEIDTLE